MVLGMAKPKNQMMTPNRQQVIDALEAKGGFITGTGDVGKTGHDNLLAELQKRDPSWTKTRYYSVVTGMHHAGFLKVEPFGKALRPRRISLTTARLEALAEEASARPTKQRADGFVMSAPRAAILAVLEQSGGVIESNDEHSALTILFERALELHPTHFDAFRRVVMGMQHAGKIVKFPPGQGHTAQRYMTPEFAASQETADAATAAVPASSTPPAGEDHGSPAGGEIVPLSIVPASHDGDGVAIAEEELAGYRAEVGAAMGAEWDLPAIPNVRELADQLLIAVAEKLAGEPGEASGSLTRELDEVKGRLGAATEYGNAQHKRAEDLAIKLSAQVDTTTALQQQVARLKGELEVVSGNVQAMLKGEHDGGRSRRALEKFMQQTPHQRQDRQQG